ncbi:formate/nitrite transporter family protein [Mesoplasma photuris]|uniref:formate/nitrite transporter family protein n=1 Tax=Mesoplasma photuris TaxID=217731 RepID=UPI000559EA26|nr:formate/nitrite transporter family protein [Mesoplasma photuris]
MKLNLKQFKTKPLNDLNDSKLIEKIKELEEIDYSKLSSPDLPFFHHGYVHTFGVIRDSLRWQWRKQLVAGILAGIFIGVAYVAVVFATASIDNVSVKKLLTGTLFSGVILLIAFLGGGFLTAYFWMNKLLFTKGERWKIYLKACGLVYLGNILGIGIFSALLLLSKTFGQAQIQMIQDSLIYGKMYGLGDQLKSGGLSNITISIVFKALGFVFASAILCNFLVCLAAQGAKSTKGNVVASMIMNLLVIFYFSLAGYQHTVANWFGAWFALLGPISGTGFTLDVNAGWLFIVINIIPAFFGNWLGATIMTWFIAIFNKEFEVLLIKKYRLQDLKMEFDNRQNS